MAIAHDGDLRRSHQWDLAAGPGNYAWTVAAQVVLSMLSLTSVWVATRVLGPSGYGAFAATIAAAQVLMQVVIDWSAASLVRYGCEEFIHTGRISTTFWARTAVLAVAMTVLACTSPLWWPLLASMLHLPHSALPVVMGYLIACALWTHLQFTLLAAKLPRVRSLLLVVERAVILGVLLILTATHAVTAFALTLTYVAAAFIAAAGGLVVLRPLLGGPVAVDLTLLRRMLTFSLPLLPASLLGYFTTSYVDALFILHYLSSADLGQYAVAYLLAGAVMQLPQLLGSLLLPLFITLEVRPSGSLVGRVLDDGLPFFTLMWSIFCAIVACAATLVVPPILGPAFAKTGPLIWPLLAAAALAGPVLTVYLSVAQARSLTYVNVLAALTGAVVNVTLDLMLIPRFGLMGAAWATASAYAISMLVWVGLLHHPGVVGRVRVIEATTPAVAGAIVAIWWSNLAALAVALAVGATLILFRRGRIVQGIRLLREVRA